MSNSIKFEKKFALGANELCIVTKISNTKVYEDGKPTGQISGVTVSIVLPEKNFEQISVKIPLHSADEYPSNKEIEEAAENLDFYVADFEEFEASLSLHNDFEGKAYKKQAFIKYTASNVVITKIDKGIDLFGGDN